MSCRGTSVEQETCNVEKMGCEGCAYYVPNDEDTYKLKIYRKITELEADPKYGHQTWFDEDVVNMLYELIEE